MKVYGLLSLLVLCFTSVAWADPPKLDWNEGVALARDQLVTPPLVIALGEFRVRSNGFGYPQGGEIAESAFFGIYKAWADVGAIFIYEDPEWQAFRLGTGKGDNLQIFSENMSGVLTKIKVWTTWKANADNSEVMDGSLILFRPTLGEIREVRDVPFEEKGAQYRKLSFEYHQTMSALYSDVLKRLGAAPVYHAKARVLYKFDEFTQMWTFVRVDVAEFTHDFTTHNVE